ncbi:hypothetical protein [Achromobacter marplatensis]|uniref:hypothetical protein n=1 Tax=Achromobacter marplatensis TaxID=470868 RepID=UPI003D0054F3
MPAPVAAQYGAGMEGTHLYLAEMQGEVKPLRTARRLQCLSWNPWWPKPKR